MYDYRLFIFKVIPKTINCLFLNIPGLIYEQISVPDIRTENAFLHDILGQFFLLCWFKAGI